LDTKGIHHCSCTGGGDVTGRHNEIRNKLNSYASRGRLNPELEKMGLLDEPAVVVSLRRPADVLVDGSAQAPGSFRKVAWDVKVINALGVDHRDATLQSPLAAADAYRMSALEHQDTANLCAEKGIKYEPLVFTAQGGIQKNAEAILSALAVAIARTEGKALGKVKAEILEDLSLTLVRWAARSVMRRAPTPVRLTSDACSRLLAEAPPPDM
jgi:hypothetical protein